MAMKSRDRAGSMLMMMLACLFVACGSMQPAERVMPTVRTAASLSAGASTEAAPTPLASPIETVVAAGQPAPLPPPSSPPAASPSSLVPRLSATSLIDRPIPPPVGVRSPVVLPTTVLTPGPLATVPQRATRAVPLAPMTTPPRPTTSSMTRTPRPELSPTPIAASGAHASHYFFPILPASMGTYGTCHHDYPASDIFVPIGTHFVAVSAGVVDAVSYQDTWNPAVNSGASRGGLSVALIGDDGVRYYGSHLSQIADGIAPGVRVRAGQLLGLSGQSGDARVTAPHVHFGISRPTTPGDWATRRGTINPYRYLQAWRTGIELTPDLGHIGGGIC